jgi:hypothetical protein
MKQFLFELAGAVFIAALIGWPFAFYFYWW